MFTRLERQLGPWPLGNPARFVAKVGLGDTAWQAAQKRKLQAASSRLATLLANNDLPSTGGTALFQYVQCAFAAPLYERLAQRGILVRYFAEPSALRLGLPENEMAWARLENALGDVMGKYG
jgi:cobalamin biosynthetic protein CobC